MAARVLKDLIQTSALDTLAADVAIGATSFTGLLTPSDTNLAAGLPATPPYDVTLEPGAAGEEKVTVTAVDAVNKVFTFTPATTYAHLAGRRVIEGLSLDNLTSLLALRLIQRIVVGTDISAPAASVTFSSIPGSYKNLQVRVLGRGDAVATSVGIKLQFNGDTGSNYSTENLQASAASVTGAEGLGITAMTIGNIAAASAPANAPGAVTCHVLQYASTLFDKVSINPWFMRRAATTTNTFTGFLSGVWFPSTPAAITSITFLLSSGNFASGAVIEVYGEG